MSKIDRDAEEEIKDQVYRQGNRLVTFLNKQCSGAGSFPELGLCNKCASFRGIVTEFGLRKAACAHQLAPLTGKQKIRECSLFWDRTHQGLQSLLDMNPLMVDPKETIGF